MENIKFFKKMYDKLGNDYLRSTVLTAAGILGVRKDIIRMDTNCCCNIRCIMCNSKPIPHSVPYMNFEDFQIVMDQLGPTARMLYLSCAYEPLITPDFVKYLKYAKGKKIPHISFCTNALLLNTEMIHALIEYQIDEMIISFNGFCKEDYNRIMKGADFDKVCANLKELSDIKKKHHSDKPKVRLNTVLLNSNISHLEEMFQLVNDYDIDLVQFRELMLYEDQNDPQEVKKELPQNQSLEEHQKMTRRIQKITKKLHDCGKKIIIPESILQLQNPTRHVEALSMKLLPVEVAKEFHPPLTEERWSLEKRDNKKKHRCSIPFFSYWIDYQGEVSICGYDKRGTIGNILTDSPNVLAKKRRAFKKRALSGTCKHKECTINIDTSTVV